MLLALASGLGACRREGAVRFDTSDSSAAPQATAPGVATPGPGASPPPPPASGWGPVQPVAWNAASAEPWRQQQVAYPLDSFDRRLSSGQLSCPEVDARDFAGESLRFSPAAKVIEPFRQRLVAFEQVVREVSERVYGRWPSAILVAASYGCRSVRSANRKLSEHALGNAIDVTGFEFAPVPLALPAWLPSPLTELASGFQVRVDPHWQATEDAIAARHAYFLDELTRQLLARGIFRTLLGPAQADHEDHFHFDMAPWSYVNL